MTVKLLAEHHLEFPCLKEAAQARLSLHLSKCHIEITCRGSDGIHQEMINPLPASHDLCHLLPCLDMISRSLVYIHYIANNMDLDYKNLS